MKSHVVYKQCKCFNCIRISLRPDFLIVFFFLVAPFASFCQVTDTYDEISVTLNVQRLGSIEIAAVIHNEEAYLPIKDVFDYLKIKSFLSQDYDTVSGFFISPKALFLVDKINNLIHYENRTINLKPGDLIRTSTNLYLKSGYFSQVFGLECPFTFRSLSVNLVTKLDIPAIKEIQQDAMRKNVGKLKGEKKVDTTIENAFSLFKLGIVEWNVNSTQASNLNTTAIVSLGVGAIVAGGEVNVIFNHSSIGTTKNNQQVYRWRYVNNKNANLSQVTLGRVSTSSISSLLAPVNGVQITNQPTTFRRSFGTYRISNTTEPGWTVELYVNEVLVDFVKADASGFFSFDVPIVYGNSIIKLRFYSPYGEERVSEQTVNIPFNFLPVNRFEYNLTAGILEDDRKSKFSRALLNYGLSKRMTVGAGVEYLSAIAVGKSMPFINASLRLGPKVVVAGQHTYGVSSKGMINYRLPWEGQFEVNYTKYEPGQTAVNINYLEERKAVITMPLRGNKMVAFSRLTFNQVTMPKFTQTFTELLLSSVVSGVSTNITTTAVYTDPSDITMLSNAALTFRLPKRIRLTPQAQFDYKQKSFNMLKCEAEKNVSGKGLLSLTYEKSMTAKAGYLTLGFRYNFSFAQTAFFARHGNKISSTTLSAFGSLLYDDYSRKIIPNGQSSIGRGGLVISPFLDLNCNGVRDLGEPNAPGLNLKVNGGKIERKDGVIRIFNLDAYTDYIIELDKSSFDNIAWQIKNATIKVQISPNTFKVVEVPVAVVGEVSGTVFVKNAEDQVGQGRILVNIFNSRGNIIARTVTESDGFFTYIGLAPGRYTAKIDPKQLATLKMISSGDIIFTLKKDINGGIADGLKILLSSSNRQ
ncbi:MAG: Sporulation Domain-Containing Protein [Segetibacter sp.]|nr:Sporulation Domain-Containing Protein [Segetibacter sp.]